jgi:hypothetical protein
MKRKRKHNSGCLFSIFKLPFLPIKILIAFSKWLIDWSSNEVQEELIKPRKKCLVCNSKHIGKVGEIVSSDYEGVTIVDERWEHNFIKPKPIISIITFKQWVKLSIILSLFFTPFAGPFLAFIVKIFYDGRIDKDLTRKDLNIWRNQKFCFVCGITWKEIT